MIPRMTNTDLRDWMRAHRYSVRTLSHALGVSPSTVTRWRSGEITITRIVILALDSLARPNG